MEHLTWIFQSQWKGGPLDGEFIHEHLHGILNKVKNGGHTPLKNGGHAPLKNG